MTRLLRQALTLTLTGAAAVSCNDATTETETPATAQPAPDFAVASNSWITRADMPGIERTGLAAASTTNAAGQWIIYAVGGKTGTSGSLSNVQAYNAATNSWSTKAPLPAPRYQTNGIGVIKGKLYISGGLGSFNNFRKELYVYNPANNTWTRKRDMPSPSALGVSGVINDQLYVVTGCDQDQCSPTPQKAFFRYDPVADLWTTLPPPPNSHPFGQGGVIGGKFYVAGISGRLDVYDPATNLWTTKAPLPKRRWLGAGVSAGGRLYVIGGCEGDLSGPDQTCPVRTNNYYNPSTDSWTLKAPLPRARDGVAGATAMVDGVRRVHVIGGTRPGNNVAYVP